MKPSWREGEENRGLEVEDDVNKKGAYSLERDWDCNCEYVVAFLLLFV